MVTEAEQNPTQPQDEGQTPAMVEAQRAMQLIQLLVGELMKTAMTSATQELLRVVDQWIVAQGATPGPSAANGMLVVSSAPGVRVSLLSGGGGN